jgi:hypothetical protein
MVLCGGTLARQQDSSLEIDTVDTLAAASTYSRELVYMADGETTGMFTF